MSRIVVGVHVQAVASNIASRKGERTFYIISRVNEPNTGINTLDKVFSRGLLYNLQHLLMNAKVCVGAEIRIILLIIATSCFRSEIGYNKTQDTVKHKKDTVNITNVLHVYQTHTHTHKIITTGTIVKRTDEL